MRLLLIISLVFSIASCSKNKSVAKDVGGQWKMVRLVKDDGSEYTENIEYTFDNASTDGKTFTSWSSYNFSDSVETTGTYCITGKGLYMVINTNTEAGIFIDSAKVEDIDKKSMIIRMKQGLNFFKKVIPD